MNMLQRSVLSDLKDENIYQEIVALAIIGKIITTPFMQMMSYHQKQASYRLFVYS
jgi:hypothetical protein